MAAQGGRLLRAQIQLDPGALAALLRFGDCRGLAGAWARRGQGTGSCCWSCPLSGIDEGAVCGRTIHGTGGRQGRNGLSSYHGRDKEIFVLFVCRGAGRTGR